MLVESWFDWSQRYPDDSVRQDYLRTPVQKLETKNACTVPHLGHSLYHHKAICEKTTQSSS